jgi:serine/threonine-protein kinase HipA
MMTSEAAQAFVWIWLPEAVEPVVAGRLDDEGGIITFTYGRSYLSREDAIPVYLPELPLKRGSIAPEGRNIAGCIADAAPDSWGQRVIENRRAGAEKNNDFDWGPLSYLLESGSDRIGALDFQRSSTTYVPRTHDGARLDELQMSARRVEDGVPLAPALDAALLRGSSVGGARPKALVNEGSRRMIAKFSSSSDAYPVLKGEFVAMELARRAGLDVATVQLIEVLGKDVLLVDRFDRSETGERRLMVSALTILGLDEIAGRYATYVELAKEIERRFTDASDTLRELFGRITFNILTGNTDDHARNHAAFWDGQYLQLTPAYDICPQTRSGGEAQQLMAIGPDGDRMSQLAGCLKWASVYHVFSERDARSIIDHQIEVINTEWEDVCEEARLTEVEKTNYLGTQFLNPYAFFGY